MLRHHVHALKRHKAFKLTSHDLTKHTHTQKSTITQVHDCTNALKLCSTCQFVYAFVPSDSQTVQAGICNSVVSSKAASPLQIEDTLAMQFSAKKLIERTADYQTEDLP